MLTASGLWLIENQTRYNTEDIVAAFNAVEKHITETTTEPLASRCTARPGTIRFRDYSPASRLREVNRWVNGVRFGQMEVNYVRQDDGRCASDRVLGLLVPSKLYASPLEALSAGSQGPAGEEIAPEDFTRALVLQVIRHLYYGGDWSRLSVLPMPAIRVMKRREAKKQTIVVKSLMLGRARLEDGRIFTRVYEAKIQLTAAEACFPALQDALKAVDMEPGFTLEDLQSVIARTSEILAAMAKTSDQLTRATQ